MPDLLIREILQGIDSLLHSVPHNEFHELGILRDQTHIPTVEHAGNVRVLFPETAPETLRHRHLHRFIVREEDAV